jgi:hypothetical protein
MAGRSVEVSDRRASTRIEGIGTVLVGNRPNRVEPRAVKRRPKPHKLLPVPREKARVAARLGDESEWHPPSHAGRHA